MLWNAKSRFGKKCLHKCKHNQWQTQYTSSHPPMINCPVNNSNHVLFTCFVSTGSRSGVNQWRDQLKPTQLLYRLCERRNYKLPVYKQDRVYFRGQEYTVADLGQCPKHVLSLDLLYVPSTGLIAFLLIPKSDFIKNRTQARMHANKRRRPIKLLDGEKRVEVFSLELLKALVTSKS